MHTKTKVPETTLNQFRCQMVLFNGEFFLHHLATVTGRIKVARKKRKIHTRRERTKLEGDDDEKDARDGAARFFFVPVPGAYDLDFAPQDHGRAVAITTSTPS